MVQWRHNRHCVESATQHSAGSVDSVAVSTASSKFPAVVGLPHPFVPPCPAFHLFLLPNWSLASPHGRVGLHSVDPFHYKLLPWSLLKWHWRTEWLLWRSVLMCHLIMLSWPTGVRLSVVRIPTFLKLKRASVKQWILNRRGIMDGSYRRWCPHPCTPVPHTHPTAPDSSCRRTACVTLSSGLRPE